jgi:phage baseplate assembly protein W
MTGDYYYKGFSFKNFQRNKSFIITDIEVVKEDLRNHIFTRFGERVKMANFGSRIPDMPFEPLDISNLSIIYEDMETVFNYDPRVELLNLTVLPDFDENIVLVYAELYYREINLNDRFDLKIEFQN